MDPTRWRQARVIARVDWAPGLFSFTLDEPRAFAAGQFTLLAREDSSARRGRIQRAYSIASAPGAPLEFFVVEVEDGALSPTLARTQVGDPVWLGRRTTGRFTLDRVPSAPVLWMFATGTGLAPYLSMLREGTCFQRFDRVVVVHGVRTRASLAYRSELEALQAWRPLSYVPVCSRDPQAEALTGRIPARLEDDSLARRSGVGFEPLAHQVMLCGNPAMIDQMTHQLSALGMGVPTPSSAGQVHLERYW